MNRTMNMRSLFDDKWDKKHVILKIGFYPFTLTRK